MQPDNRNQNLGDKFDRDPASLLETWNQLSKVYKQDEVPEQAGGSQTLDELIMPRTLKGFRDILPREAELKREMLNSLENVFQSFGYSKIETPHLEYAEVLLGKEDGEIGKQVYRFKDHGERDVALRFDLTVPLARFIAQHQADVGLPFRRYAIGNVFRGENTQAGRYREFTQCDFDIIGSEKLFGSRSADAEVVQVMVAALEELGLADFTIKINNRKIFNGLCENVGLLDQSVSILRSVDKISKIGIEGVKKELCENGVDGNRADFLLGFLRISEGRSPAETLQALAPFRSQGGLLGAGIDELRETCSILASIPNLRPVYTIDLSIARGLGYYTGVVFETFLNNQEAIGSVCSGGRYDNLASTFSKSIMPGVGASVGLDRLMAALSVNETRNTRLKQDTILIMSDDRGSVADSHQLAAVLREHDWKVEIYPYPASKKNQFNYANRNRHGFAISVIADDRYLVSRLSDGQKSDTLGKIELIDHFKRIQAERLLTEK